MNAASNMVSEFFGSMPIQCFKSFAILSNADTMVNRTVFAVLAALSVVNFGNRFWFGAKKFNPLKGPWFGTAWEGTFDADHSGTGKKISSIGEIWKGTFVNGKLHGQGKYTTGWAVKKGQFENDQLINGTITELPMKKYIFFGELTQPLVRRIP